MRIGLSFSEYVELFHGRRRGMSLSQVVRVVKRDFLPLDAREAALHLRCRGYAVDEHRLEEVGRQLSVPLSRDGSWGFRGIEAAARWLEDEERFRADAALCQALGCAYVVFLRALRKAARRESKRTGRFVPADRRFFVMHFAPGGKQPKLWFSLDRGLLKHLPRLV